MEGPQLQKGGKGKATISAHWDIHLFRAALSSVSEQAMKSAKNRPFLLPGLHGTVAVNREASELQLR